MIYRIVFGFSGAGQGWAETHAMLSPLNNPVELMPTLSDIATKRVQMLGREFSIVGIRASRYSDDAGVRQRGSKLQKRTFTNSVTTASAGAEPSNVALQVIGGAKPNVLNPIFDANENQTFLGAPLDICVNNAGEVDTSKGGLLAAFASWKSAVLAANLGWLASQTIFNGAIATTVQNGNGTVTFTTVDNTVPPLTQGVQYLGRVRRVNQGVSPLNGEIIVVAGANKSLTTLDVIGIPTPQTGGFLRIYKAVAPFVAYGTMDLSERVVKHKRGRPFGSTPGRAKKRIRG